ncbi:hypothetical protein [Kitasatospora sp. NPDC088134]|uniref:hypothetical protein n=1 Tax=Kitasatospora sp. NPDC088134 TaxID=3364071 RepID=UPI0038046685
MEHIYIWSAKHYPDVLYAPDVRPEERVPRLEETPGWTEQGRWRRRRAAIDALGERAIRTIDDIPKYHGLRVHGLDTTTDFPEDVPALQHVWRRCQQVWRSAQAVSGVVDLQDVDHVLAGELWVCTSLIKDLFELSCAPYETGKAQQELYGKLVERLQDLERLQRENEDLYRAAGSNSTTLPEVVRKALARAEVVGEYRPAHELSEVTGEMRELVQKMRDAPSAAVEEPE